MAIAASANFCNAQGPYSILLETGDTVVTPTYFTKVDSLGFKGGVVAKKDVVLFWTPKERWTFTHPKGKMVKVREKGSDPCVSGRIAAERFADNNMEFDSLPMPASWKMDSVFLTCYRSALLDRNIITEESGDRFLPEQSEDQPGEYFQRGRGAVAIGQPNQLIRVNGDTLFIKKDFYHKDSLLCWYGGSCIPERELLLLRTVKGQFYYSFLRKARKRLAAPIPNMSVASLARLHANRYFASGYAWIDTDIPEHLRADPAFLEGYRNEVQRLVVEAERELKRLNTMSVLAGGMRGAAIGGALGGAVGGGLAGATRRIEDQPYWGTPMPE